MKLDGTIVGQVRQGREAAEGIRHASIRIDCRSENNLLVGEAANMRVQKLTLKE